MNEAYERLVASGQLTERQLDVYQTLFMHQAVKDSVERFIESLRSWTEGGLIQEFNMRCNRRVQPKYTEVGLMKHDKMDIGDWHISLDFVLATAREIDLKEKRNAAILGPATPNQG